MINYYNIDKALEFYQAAGFSLIEVPWVVSGQAIYATAPQDSSVKRIARTEKYLVASGEQSFVELMLQGKLYATKYVCVTPCFREEYKYDEFLKVELISIGNTDCTQELTHLALEFFNTFLNVNLYTWKNLEGTDIIGKYPEYPNSSDDNLRVELGSYGLRSYRGYNWTYGTGLAEPRFSEYLKLRTL